MKDIWFLQCLVYYGYGALTCYIYFYLRQVYNERKDGDE